MEDTLDDPSDPLITIKSFDDKWKIDVPVKQARISGLIAAALDTDPGAQEIILGEVVQTCLFRIGEYMNICDGKEPDVNVHEVQSNNFLEEGTSGPFQFIESLTIKEFAEIWGAADYMEIKSLVILCALKIATVIKNKDIDTVRRDLDCSSDKFKNPSSDSSSSSSSSGSGFSHHSSKRTRRSKKP